MEQVKRPDEVDSFEYLAEHLWEQACLVGRQAHNGGLNDDFEGLKVILPYLERYANLSEVLNRIAKRNQRLRNRLGKDLISLYSPDPDVGPTTMELLLLVLWPDLTALYKTLPEFAFSSAVPASGGITAAYSWQYSGKPELPDYSLGMREFGL
jgi:hypothetical protein